MKSFYSDKWDDGFGGFPWATCAWYSYCLWQSIIHTYNLKSSNLSEKSISKLIGSINKTTNLAHNNGWWFNKITETDTMDFAAKNPGLVAFSCADLYYKFHKLVENIKIKDNILKMKEIKPPFAKDKNGNIVWYRVKTSSDYWGSGGPEEVYVNIYKENGTELEKNYILSEKNYEFYEQYYNAKPPLKNGFINLPHGKKVKIV